MAEELKMNFYKSVYDLASVFPEKGRRALLVAMLDYFFEGTEPDSLGARERKAFEAVRGRIDASKTNGSNRRGKKRGESRNETGNESRNETHNESHNETGNESHNESRNETHNEKLKSMGTDISLSLSHRNPSGMDSGCNSSWEGVQGEGDAFEPPTIDEVRAYFGANALRGDPEDFFLHFEAQGWVNGNGQAIANWQARALKWSRDQVSRDADRLARGEPAPEQAVWRPAQETDPEEDLRRAEEEFRRRYGGDAA